MNIETEFFLGAGGIILNATHWISDEAKYVLCIVHGHGEHGGRYKELADALVKEHVSVLAVDLRGHGQSEGKRGHAPSLDALLDDLEEFLKLAREQYNDLPMYLMGHSMGGNLVANYLVRDTSSELSGFILSSPWFKLAFEPPAIKVKLSRLLNRVWSSYSEENGLDTTKLSRIAEEVDLYNSDPLVHGKISVGLYNSILQGAEKVFTKIEKISKPALIYHGSADEIIDHKTTESFARLNPSLFEWHLLSGVFHEPHHDLGKEKIPELISGWIKKISHRLIGS